ncbi:MAG: hypothetical protein ACT4NV_11080, partial [Rhodoferax sp.]
MMMGKVKDFSWNAVGQAALQAGVSAGVDIGLKDLAEAGKAGDAANAVAQAYAKAGEVTRAVVRQALVTTVVGVAKREFSWRAVVSSAVSAGIAQKMGSGLSDSLGSAMGTGTSQGATDWGASLGQHLGHITAQAAGSMVGT